MAQQILRLYNWYDKAKQRTVREFALARLDPANRNGKNRFFAWSADPEEFNYYLYPDFGTAYAEFDNRVQPQRPSKRYLYELVREGKPSESDQPQYAKPDALPPEKYLPSGAGTV